MSTLHIGHAPHTGTILTGTSIKDGAGIILRHLGWRWARTFNHWYVPGSRHSEPSIDLVNVSRNKLEDAGFEVIIDDLFGSPEPIGSGMLTRDAQKTRRQIARALRTIKRIEGSLVKLKQQRPSDAVRIAAAEQLLAAELAALLELENEEHQLNEAGAQIFTLASLTEADAVLYQSSWLRIVKVNRTSVIVSASAGLRKLSFLDLESHRTEP